jgi:hypothetical protein
MEEQKPKQLGSLPVDIQETFLIEDILFAMTSIEGVYIRRKTEKPGTASTMANTGGPSAFGRAASGKSNTEFEVEPYLP